MLTGRGSLTDHFDREKMYFNLIKSLAGNVSLMPMEKNPNKQKEAPFSFGCFELSMFSRLKVDF